MLPNEYVQRRAVARVTVGTDPPVKEEVARQQHAEVVVTPDLPNDLEILDATARAAATATSRW